MADLRDQLRKAGLISEKQLRQAKHKERVHAKETGHDGLAEERRKEEARLKSEREHRKREDRLREKERLEKQKDASSVNRLAQLIQSGTIRDAGIGTRRFFFPTKSGRITYLDLSETATRMLVCGKAAIVEAEGPPPARFCVLTERAASEIKEIDADRLLFWNEQGAMRPPR